MTAQWFSTGVSPWELVLRTAIVYVLVIVFLRLAGKKQMGQMGPTEFIAVLLLSNSVQNAMVGVDTTLIGGIISAGTLVVLSRLISWATFRSARMRALLEGSPTVLVQDGRLIQENLNHELLTKGDLIKLLREQGVETIADARLAVLDTEGSLTVATGPKDATQDGAKSA